jgi:hypothetical protein
MSWLGETISWRRCGVDADAFCLFRHMQTKKKRQAMTRGIAMLGTKMYRIPILLLSRGPMSDNEAFVIFRKYPLFNSELSTRGPLPISSQNTKVQMESQINHTKEQNCIPNLKTKTKPRNAPNNAHSAVGWGHTTQTLEQRNTLERAAPNTNEVLKPVVPTPVFLSQGAGTIFTKVSSAADQLMKYKTGRIPCPGEQNLGLGLEMISLSSNILMLWVFWFIYLFIYFYILYNDNIFS